MQNQEIDRVADAIAEGVWTQIRNMFRPLFVGLAVAFGIAGVLFSNQQLTGFGIMVAILLVAEAIHK